MTQTLRAHYAAHDRSRAAAAADQIHANLYNSAPNQAPKEFVYTLSECWMQEIFYAVCRSHGLVPFREYGMRRDKIMTIAPPALIANVVGPKLQNAWREMGLLVHGLTDRYLAEHLNITPEAPSTNRAP